MGSEAWVETGPPIGDYTGLHSHEFNASAVKTFSAVHGTSFITGLGVCPLGHADCEWTAYSLPVSFFEGVDGHATAMGGADVPADSSQLTDGDPSLVIEKPVLELARNVEVQLGGSFYISKEGYATYESRYHRHG
jgi:hypothetical protein